MCYNENMTHEETLAIFDTHTHLNVEQFDGRVQEELDFAKEMGVTLHNVVGFDRATIDKAMELADQHPEIYLTLGWHPTELGLTTNKAFFIAILLSKYKLPLYYKVFRL